MEKLELQVGFFIQSHLSKENPVPLYKPNFIEWKDEEDYDLVYIETCVENFEELIAYYTSLLKAINHHPEERIKDHIWLRFGLFLNDEIIFSFSWFDRLVYLKKMREDILENLEDNEEVLYSRGEQGWYFCIEKHEDKILLAETTVEDYLEIDYSIFQEKLFSKNKKYQFEFDDENEFVEYTWAWENFDFFMNQLDQKIKITEELIHQLVEHFGEDYWTF